MVSTCWRAFQRHARSYSIARYATVSQVVLFGAGARRVDCRDPDGQEQVKGTSPVVRGVDVRDGHRKEAVRYA